MIAEFISPEILGIVFLLIQGVSELFKSYYAMARGKWPGNE